MACCQAPSDLPKIETQLSTIELEAPIQKACVGGRGRFLIASLLGRREVVVVDLFKRFVSLTIPLGEDDVELAAGATQLHVVAPDSGLFQTWDLRTGERLLETAWPLRGYVKKIAMGSGNDKQLAACFANSPHPDEASQWATIELPSMDIQHLTIADEPTSKGFQLRASTDGSLFVAWAPQSKPQNRGVILIRQSHAQWLNWPESPNYILLNESGSRLYTEAGVLTLNLIQDQSVGIGTAVACVPSVTGQMFLTRESQDDAGVWKLRSLDRRLALATIRIDVGDPDYVAVTTSKLGQPLILSVEAGYIAT